MRCFGAGTHAGELELVHAHQPFGIAPGPRFLDRVAKSAFGLEPHDYRLVVAERSYDTAVTNIAGVLAREALRGERGGQVYAESLASILAVHLLRHYAQRADGRALDSSPPREETTPTAPPEAGNRNAAHPRAVSDALESSMRITRAICRSPTSPRRHT
jgi:hypothetical protein